MILCNDCIHLEGIQHRYEFYCEADNEGRRLNSVFVNTESTTVEGIFKIERPEWCLKYGVKTTKKIKKTKYQFINETI